MITLNALWTWIRLGASTAMADTTGENPPAQVTHPPKASVDGAPSQMTDINDIKPILDIGGDWIWVLYLIAGILILTGLLALAWWLWKRRKKTETILPSVPDKAPDAEAYDALDALAAEKGLAPKQFYFRLSAVLRHYMERRYDFPAAEMTTEELMPRVDQLTMDASLAQEFKGFCRMADPIKFAGATAQHDRLAQDLAFSRNFVRQTTIAVEVVDNQEEKSSMQLVDGEPR